MGSLDSHRNITLPLRRTLHASPKSEPFVSKYVGSDMQFVTLCNITQFGLDG